jgi:hypothetical protein
MIQLHTINIQQRFADAKIDGDKLFEICLNDKYYQKGDLIQYKVTTNPENYGTIRLVNNHPLNERIYEITYVYVGIGLEAGYVILGERDVTEDYINKTGKFENLQKLEWSSNNE